MTAFSLALFKHVKPRYQVLILGLLFLTPTGISLFARQSGERAAPVAKAAGAAAAAPASDDRLLSIGKKLFVQRCASCHNERGDKPLATGLPLIQRKLDNAVVERAVRARLKSNTADQQRAVALYIESLLQK